MESTFAVWLSKQTVHLLNFVIPDAAGDRNALQIRLTDPVRNTFRPSAHDPKDSE